MRVPAPALNCLQANLIFQAMKQHSDFPGFSIALLIGCSITCVQAQGTLLVRHSGSANPTSEGFFVYSSYGSPQLGAVTNDMGLDAWSMRLSSAGINYRHAITDLSGLDWRLSVSLRVVEDSISSRVFSVGLDTGQHTFGLSFGLNSEGDPSVRLSGSSLSPEFVLQGAGSAYVNYELFYNAATGSAGLWVNGVERVSDMSGAPGYSPAFGFGGGFQNPANLQANWNLVSLEIIPEPSAWALLACGAVLLAGHWLRRFMSAHGH